MRYFALETRFMHIIGYNTMIALANVQNALNYARLAQLALKQAFSCVSTRLPAKTTLNALKRVISRKNAFYALYRF